MKGTFESLTFYRGVSKSHPIDRPVLVTPRRDRRPLNTDLAVHTIADEWFKDQFGIKYRSQGVFVSPQRFIAQGYAASEHHVVRVIPLSEYKFCWSKKIADMLMLCMPPFNADEFTTRLNGADYTDEDLIAAHESGNELMLFCDKYLTIPIDLLEVTPPPSNYSSIILPQYLQNPH